jgi:hypothetical protein
MNRESVIDNLTAGEIIPGEGNTRSFIDELRLGEYFD